MGNERKVLIGLAKQLCVALAHVLADRIGDAVVDRLRQDAPLAGVGGDASLIGYLQDTDMQDPVFANDCIDVESEPKSLATVGGRDGASKLRISRRLGDAKDGGKLVQEIRNMIDELGSGDGVFHQSSLDLGGPAPKHFVSPIGYDLVKITH